jgi:tRNA(Ile)-lysidine synthase
MSLESAVAASLDRLLSSLPDTRAAQPARFLVAVSGGADSMALFSALAEYADARGHGLVAGHVAHGIRSAEEEEADLEAVRRLAGSRGVPLVVGRARRGEVRELARRTRSGVESAARSVRYRLLAAAARSCGARYICTAHSRDDQIETVLMGLVRGVGALGLAGIPEVRRLDERTRVIRPMLAVSRSEVLQYLRSRHLSWSEDATNRSLAYARNRVRQVVLPALRAANPEVDGTLLALGAAARDRREAASREADRLSWSVEGERSTISCAAFFGAGIDARLLSLFGEAARRGMNRASSRIPTRFFRPLLCGTPPQPGTVIAGRGNVIRRVRDELIWEPGVVRRGECGYLRVVTPGVPTVLPSGHSVTVYVGEKRGTEAPAIVIPLNKVRGPLVVRSYRSGDRLVASGGATSVSSILEAVGVEERRLVPVILDRDGVAAVAAGAFGGRDVYRRSGTREVE